MQEAPTRGQERDATIVAIGASAGGIEALTELLTYLPADTGMAFVLVQHLDPKHHSILTELLAKKTAMTVTEVSDGLPVKPNQVYVIPPNAAMAISDHRLHLSPREESRGAHMAVDLFMRSLAEQKGNRAIGVILSGSGTDGTLGMREIQAHGGVTFAQDEGSAKYFGMPGSAVAAGCVDYADHLAKSQGVDNIFLSISLNRGTVISYAREYSQLSVSHPTLYEVGFDDFVSQCEKLKLDPSSLSALLTELVHELKAANPKLRLGITMYEDELTSNRFPVAQLDEQFRNSVDFVHLYPHYRKEAQSFSTSVQQAMQIFPRTKIIAGNYAIDRRDYLPCSRGGAPCTSQEEISLFA